jgi:hypothetical protein
MPRTHRKRAGGEDTRAGRAVCTVCATLWMRNVRGGMRAMLRNCVVDVRRMRSGCAAIGPASCDARSRCSHNITSPHALLNPNSHDVCVKRSSACRRRGRRQAYSRARAPSQGESQHVRLRFDDRAGATPDAPLSPFPAPPPPVPRRPSARSSPRTRSRRSRRRLTSSTPRRAAASTTTSSKCVERYIDMRGRQREN